MGPRAAGGIGVAAACALAACSLGDFAGYSDGDDVPDAAADAPPIAIGDSGPDDAFTTPNDAGESDAPVEASTTFCATNGDAGFFCEDFEGADPLLHFSRTATKGGTLVVENGTLVANAPPSNDSSEVHGLIAANTIGSTARLTFSVRPEQLNLTTTHSSQLAKIYFYGTPTYEVGIGVYGKDSSGVYAYEFATNGAYKEFGTLPTLTPNGYTRFVIDVNIAGAPRLNVDRDGQRVVANVVLSPPNAQGSIEGSIGIPFTQPGHGAWKFRFDDIVMSLP